MTDDAFPWFRVYVSILDNHRLLLLADEDCWKYMKVLALKRSGVLDSDAPHLERRVAAKLRLSESVLTEVKRRLIDVGLIDENWQPIGWGKRQFMSDSGSAERMRRHRQRQRDVTVTSPSDESDALDTETESEEESDTDTPPAGGSAEGERRTSAPRRRPARRMPDDWMPSVALCAWAVAECPLVDMTAELRTIRDHEFKVAHTDWDATVRNWLRREQKEMTRRSGRAPTSSRESRHQRMRRTLDEI